MVNGTIFGMLAAEYDIVLPTWSLPVFFGLAIAVVLVVIFFVRRKS